MNHTPTNLDIKTDIRRSIMASFSRYKFNDPNFKIFFKKALRNLKEINLNKKTYLAVMTRLKMSKDANSSVEKRREDLLTAASLI